MYNPISIAPLSESQILKALKGLPVRVSAGNQHDIELSTEQLKKFAKANQLGKASTITFDPFQIQNHLGLKGSGVLKKSARANAGRIITSATNRAIRALEGSGAMSNRNMTDLYVRANQPDARKASDKYGPNLSTPEDEEYEYNGPLYLGLGVGGNIKAVAKDAGKRLIVSGTNRAIRAIDGSGVNRLKKAQRWQGFANATIRDGIDTAGKAARVYYDSMNPMAQMGFGMHGGNIKAVAKDAGKRLIVSGTDRAIRAIDGSGVNRLKKAQRWEGFANATIRDGIDTAGKAARVYYDSTNPAAQMGFGLKKRGRPRKTGGALYPAGVY